jgi:hypothetical protein
MAYSDKERDIIFENVLTQISEEGLALRNILMQNGMPSSQTFYKWLEDQNKSKQYARATEIRAEKLFDEIIDIADETSNDTYTDETGKEYTNHEVINRSRLKIDARKWVLSKLNPKKYGDKIDHTTDGEKITNIISLGSGNKPE